MQPLAIVAHSHSALWSRINLASSPHQLEHFGEWARRHPLALVFVLEDEEDDEGERVWVSSALVCNFLSEKFPRVVDLTIDLVSEGLWNLLQITNAPSLQRCNIYRDHCEPEVLTQPLFGDFAPTQDKFHDLFSVGGPCKCAQTRSCSTASRASSSASAPTLSAVRVCYEPVALRPLS